MKASALLVLAVLLAGALTAQAQTPVFNDGVGPGDKFYKMEAAKGPADDFTIAEGGTVSALSWWGKPFGGKGLDNVSGFSAAVWEGDENGPVVSTYTEWLLSPVAVEQDGDAWLYKANVEVEKWIEGQENPVYVPFTAEAETTYWLHIYPTYLDPRSSQKWSWASSDAGTKGIVRLTGSGFTPIVQNEDLAFVLYSDSFTSQQMGYPNPEPASMILAGVGLSAIAGLRRRIRK